MCVRVCVCVCACVCVSYIQTKIVIAFEPITAGMLLDGKKMATRLHAWLSLVASEAGAPFHRPTLRLLPLSLAVCSLVISYYLHMQWPHALNYDLESSYISLLLNSQLQ